MSGIQTESTTDANGGYDVGYIDNNDWMDYNVNVAAAGTYTFNFRVASLSAGGKMEVRTSAGTALGSVSVPVTGGWQTWTTVSATATLPAGAQTIRLFAVAGGFNINWLQVAMAAAALPGSVEAENYSAMSGIQTETTTDTNGGYNVGYIDNNDWMDYNVNVAAAGTYTFNFRVASLSAGGKIEVRTSAGTALCSVSVPVTGGWQTWTTVSVTATLPAGAQTIRLFAVAGGFNINWFGVASGAQATSTVSTTTTTTTTTINTTTTGPVKIPMLGKNWYQLNNQGDGVGAKQGLQQLNDGILDASVFMGYGKMFNNYNCYYDFTGLKDITISKIRFYSGNKSFAGQPFKLYAKQTFADSVLLATFDGTQYMQWVEITLPTPVKAKYLMANLFWGLPNEIEIYGTYNTDPAYTLYPKRDIKFRDQLGINEAIWDLTQGSTDINKRDTLDPTRLKLAKAFTQVRDYVEWDKIETVQGTFVYQSTLSGGWFYDQMYKGLKQNNIDVVPCFKNLPNWFLQKYYPVGMQDAENVPAPYGSNLLDPNSYILQAKAAFQFVARYGSTAVNKSLLSGVATGVLYPGDPNSPVRTVETGLNLIKYIECENERDKWWKGRQAYQTGFEYAANLSAFYDGNKNTMGAGVGVKNADPNIKVVIGGVASTSTDYMRAIIDWCKEYRGYKADGSVNLCFDVINYHSYANNAGSSQGGSSTAGAAPELAGADVSAAGFSEVARQYNVEAWITETGYDLNQGSPLHAMAIGSKTAEQVEADWSIRTALLNARNGINRTYFYQMYDYAPTSGGMFNSSGLLNEAQFNNGAWSRKLAADFSMQTQNLLGSYSYKETISSDPTVDRYQLNDTSIYALAIPDQVGRTANYTLTLATDSATIYTMVKGSDYMQMQKVKVVNGQLQVMVTETPIFVKAFAKATTTAAARVVSDSALAINQNEGKNENTDMGASIKLFPNPTTDYINLQLRNEKLQKVTVRIIEVATGRVFNTCSLNNASPYIYQQIDVKPLPSGMFIMQIIKGEESTTRRFIKM